MDKGHPRHCPTARAAVAPLALALGAVAMPANASVHALALPAVIDAVSGCALAPQPLSPASAPIAVTTSKSAAVLGGAPSALDAIRAQQASFTPSPAVASPKVADAGVAVVSLSPGIDASAPALPCSGLVASRAAIRPGTLAAIDARPLDPEHFLASKRVRIGHTSFDKDWKRVRGETLSAAQLKRMGAPPANRTEALSAVNRWANRAIRYTEDSVQYGKGDFWAGARRTLKAGRGDCEDIALVKMQLLAAAGVPHDDMILTIARDLVRNADHAVLIVRTDAGYRMLDNATDDVLDAAQNHDYRPILSFGNQARWLHGV